MRSEVIGASMRLEIERLGHRGEGVAHGPVYIPYALPGDTVLADVLGERGQLAAVLQAGADRTTPFCPYYTQCGGCAVQGYAAAAYAAWKRSIVVMALSHAGIEAGVDAAVEPLRDGHGEGRRRATFHARAFQRGLRLETEVGFMQARSHAIVAIEDCPILAPAMAQALPAARAIALTLVSLEKPLDIDVTGGPAGLDVNLRGCGPLSAHLTQKIIALAERLDLARVGNHGRSIVERRPPQLAMGRARVTPPPGAFLQATSAGEAALAALVCQAATGARHTADLFAGVGTFALRLLACGEVHAVENAPDAIAALLKADWGGPRPHALTSETRDLMQRPLSCAELARFDAVVFDPPRAGAHAQAEALAGSEVPTVIAVSCHAPTFARDARTLIDGGYRCETVTPVDQFRHTAHVEIVGVFRRPVVRKRRRLLD